MKTEDLQYDLPDRLIAQHPPAQRSDARLLVLDRQRGTLSDRRFIEIVSLLRRGDCLVLNDTKVRPARFFARRQTGGAIEGLFLDQDREGHWIVLLKGARKLKPDERFHLLSREGTPSGSARLIERDGEGQCRLWLEEVEDAERTLDRIGFPPLPPYIARDHDTAQAREDMLRYQTVYARQAGAVAAPTAGLHFTPELLERLVAQGIETATVTLHVGAGTFKPITTECIEAHRIHAERVIVGEEAAHCVNRTRRGGGRVVAVGTTSVRSLESAAVGVGPEAHLAPFDGPTRLYITPGYAFKLVDGLITNFHLPKSTLLALVSAFADLPTIRWAYRHAISQEYRFFSYGDAMLIL